jgi:hypothetical protein
MLLLLLLVVLVLLLVMLVVVAQQGRPLLGDTSQYNSSIGYMYEPWPTLCVCAGQSELQGSVPCGRGPYCCRGMPVVQLLIRIKDVCMVC